MQDWKVHVHAVLFRRNVTHYMHVTGSNVSLIRLSTCTDVLNRGVMAGSGSVAKMGCMQYLRSVIEM
jgi:hypothetical protein